MSEFNLLELVLLAHRSPDREFTKMVVNYFNLKSQIKGNFQILKKELKLQAVLNRNFFHNWSLNVGEDLTPINDALNQQNHHNNESAGEWSIQDFKKKWKEYYKSKAKKKGKMTKYEDSEDS